MAENFEYWQELYLLHAETYSFRKKVDAAAEVIDKYANMGVKSYLSVSGGKDSTAMAHLVNTTCGYDYLVVSEKDDMDFPGEREFMVELCEKFDYRLEILTPTRSLWEVAQTVDFTEDIHSKGTEFSDENFYGLLREFQRKNGYDGVFLGLRAEESKIRQWNRKKRGHIYENKDWNQWVCCPLVDWTARDVFAYLFANDVPILDVYFKTKFVGTPEKIRKSWVLPSAQASEGQAVWLKYYYPELFDRLSMINPKMRSYI